jgi:dienelactone hydrolase
MQAASDARIRRIAWAACAAVAALLPATASAATPSPFDLTCTAQADGTRFCPGNGTTERVPSWDGTPLDADVTLPAAGDGPFPTIVMLHGWGNTKTAFEATDPLGNGYNAGTGLYLPPTYHYNTDYYARKGYAVLTYSARGKGGSCGGGGAPQAQLQTGACANGFIRLADQRYEVRDTQYLVGLLVDQGIARAGALGVTGISYGAGQSLELAYIKDRIRCAGNESAAGDPCAGQPANALIPWTSPDGTPLSITAAHPRWFWSDLVSSLLPNGRFLDFDNTTAGASRNPIGVEIASLVNGLVATGDASGYYVVPQPPGGANSAWDLTTYAAVFNAGEPYGSQAQTIADEIVSYHQGFGIPNSSPAPLLLESGWNDDLFPAAESLRVYNDLRAQDPNADVALFFGDVGHARASNKQTVNAGFNDLTEAFFAKHLLGAGPDAPEAGSVTAYATTCPSLGPDAAPDGGPYTAADWNAVHPGAVFFGSPATQNVVSGGGDPQTAAAYDPIAQMPNDGCKTVPAETAPGTAVYTHMSRGFTLMGLPTISATLATSGAGGQLDARLWDVSPSGEQLLVTRGAYRLLDNQSGEITFQLHGNGYYFAPDHTAKLELLGSDAPYYRASNGLFSVGISDVSIKLPVAEGPGTTPEIVAPTGSPHRCHGHRVTLVGTGGNDNLAGTAGPDVIRGFAGNDVISGLGGKDVLCGGDGKDKLKGGSGKDMLFGQRGKDKLKGGSGKDTCKGGPKKDKASSCEKQSSI